MNMRVTNQMKAIEQYLPMVPLEALSCGAVYYAT